MADCKKCRHNYKPSTCEPKCNRMCDGESDFEPITNAMIIRDMGDKELAEFLCDISKCESGYCPAYDTCMRTEHGTMKKWLQSEAE